MYSRCEGPKIPKCNCFYRVPTFFLIYHAVHIYLGYVWFPENAKERKKNLVENYFL